MAFVMSGQVEVINLVLEQNLFFYVSLFFVYKRIMLVLDSLEPWNFRNPCRSGYSAFPNQKCPFIMFGVVHVLEIFPFISIGEKSYHSCDCCWYECKDLG